MSPFTTFNFHVVFTMPEQNRKVCELEFSECSGLEMNMDVKTIREGGNNSEQIHLAGPISYGQLTLKRGMTSTLDLWDWFELVQDNRKLRVDGEIQMHSLKRTQKENETTVIKRKNVVFKVVRCMPIKLVAPSLNAKDGEIAIEEVQLTYERLLRVKIDPPQEAANA